jgi:hypothetical protein
MEIPFGQPNPRDWTHQTCSGKLLDSGDMNGGPKSVCEGYLQRACKCDTLCLLKIRPCVAPCLALKCVHICPSMLLNLASCQVILVMSNAYQPTLVVS